MEITACLQEETEDGDWMGRDRDSARKEREEKCALCDSKWFCPKWNIQIIDITSVISHLRSRFSVISQQLDAVTRTKSFHIMVSVGITAYSCLLIFYIVYAVCLFDFWINNDWVIVSYERKRHMQSILTCTYIHIAWMVNFYFAISFILLRDWLSEIIIIIILGVYFAMCLCENNNIVVLLLEELCFLHNGYH